MKKILSFIFSLSFIISMSSCGSTENSSETPSTVQEVTENSTEQPTEEEVKDEITEDTTEEVTDEVTEDTTEENTEEKEHETVPPETVGYDGMTPVYADSLNDGVYSISVDSSSSMFSIASCELTVSEGEMSAKMTMSGTGYLYLFMGTGEDALNADESEYIGFEENENGEHVFTVPVEALDKVIDCASFSKRKEEWYDRQLVFRADSLPMEALSESSYNTAESLGLQDGIYSIDVSLEGGSGKASVSSPAKITVADGTATAEIIWSSNKYDYMVVDGEKYLPESTEEFSIFEIPVTAFDFKMPVSADTTAMSTPHEIEYTLYFDSESISEWTD